VRAWTPAREAACGGSGSHSERQATGRIDRDTLSQRQKDSLVSTMPLPGASGIRDAQRAQDAAAERNRILDSIASGR
jgi:hypothetical protein